MDRTKGENFFHPSIRFFQVFTTCLNFGVFVYFYILGLFSRLISFSTFQCNQLEKNKTWMKGLDSGGGFFGVLSATITAEKGNEWNGGNEWNAMEWRKGISFCLGQGTRGAGIV